MDPNATLAAIRQIVDDDGADLGGDGEALVELVHSLDTWLVRGGFPPSDWSIACTRTA